MTVSAHTTLTEVIEAAITSRLADTYHALPGIVVAYYPLTFEADIQIAVNDPRFDPDTDALEAEAWPVWPRMRVAWPRFGATTLVGTILPGAKVQCFFQDLDDSVFRDTGQQSDPARTRRFGSDSAFCIPIDLTDGGVATVTDALALASVLDLVMKALKTWVPVANDGGGALKTALASALTAYDLVGVKSDVKVAT